MIAHSHIFFIQIQSEPCGNREEEERERSESYVLRGNIQRVIRGGWVRKEQLRARGTRQRANNIRWNVGKITLMFCLTHTHTHTHTLSLHKHLLYIQLFPQEIWTSVASVTWTRPSAISRQQCAYHSGYLKPRVWITESVFSVIHFLLHRWWSMNQSWFVHIIITTECVGNVLFMSDAYIIPISAILTVYVVLQVKIPGHRRFIVVVLFIFVCFVLFSWAGKQINYNIQKKALHVQTHAILHTGHCTIKIIWRRVTSSGKVKQFQLPQKAAAMCVMALMRRRSILNHVQRSLDLRVESVWNHMWLIFKGTTWRWSTDEIMALFCIAFACALSQYILLILSFMFIQINLQHSKCFSKPYYVLHDLVLFALPF